MSGSIIEKVDYARLLAILTVHQFAAYESNGVVRVVPDANARQLPIPVTTEVPANALDDEYVTVMITARTCAWRMRCPCCVRSCHRPPTWRRSPQSNTLIISDHAANARRIVDMVERLDKAAPAGQKCPPESPPAKKDK